MHQTSTSPQTPTPRPPRANGSTRAASVKQRGYRYRSGRTRTARVALVDLGRLLETGNRDTVREIETLLGGEIARAAREAYLRLEVEEPVA